VRLHPDETVLEGLYRAGYAYRTGCRRGGCGICKVDVVVGEVEHRSRIADTVLTADERTAGACLSCRAVPAGDITIEMRDDSLRCVNPLLARLRGSTSPAGASGSTDKE
jgi:CDP-4-dehydro-6-deoxyglucose reductase